jgi:hypothetical protein
LAPRAGPISVTTELNGADATLACLSLPGHASVKRNWWLSHAFKMKDLNTGANMSTQNRLGVREHAWLTKPGAFPDESRLYRGNLHSNYPRYGSCRQLAAWEAGSSEDGKQASAPHNCSFVKPLRSTWRWTFAGRAPPRSGSVPHSFWLCSVRKVQVVTVCVRGTCSYSSLPIPSAPIDCAI